MNKIYFILIGILLAFGLTAYAVPALIYQKTILPETADTYNLGSSASKWLNIYSNYASTTAISGTNVCIGSSCRTTWPSISAPAQLGQIGDVSTSSPMTYGEVIRYNTATSKWESVATSTLGLGGSSGTVSSVAMTVPTGLSISGSPITSAGTLALTLTSGYAIPTTTRMLNWDLASTHKTTEDALNGLVKVDGSGVYSAITDSSSDWNTAFGWGNHGVAGYIPNAYYATTTHPLISSLPSLSITKSQVSDFGTYESVLTFNYPLTRATNAISMVATSSLNLLVGSFLSPNISQWTNDAGYTTSGGVGTISTSSALTIGGILYATSNGYPALVSTVATTTLTASSPLSLDNPVVKVGGSNSVLTISTAGTWSGLAGSATVLATPRAINGVNFDGSGPITITAASSTLLANANTWTGANTFTSTLTGTLTGNASTATTLATPRNINGVAFDGSAAITITAASSTLLANNNLFSGNNTFGGTLTGTLTGNAGTASALAANPADCGANTWATTIAANGDLTCAAVTSAGITDMASYFDNRLTGTTTLSKLTTLAGLTTVGTIGTGVWQGTAIDIGSFTNLAAGRSLTLSGDSVEADTELYTGAITFHATSSSDTSYRLATTTNAATHRFSGAITITKIYGSCNQGTTTVNFDERADATPNTAGTSVFGITGLSIGSGFTNSSSTVANASIAAGVPFVFQISDASPTGSKSNFCSVSITYTKND